MGDTNTSTTSFILHIFNFHIIFSLGNFLSLQIHMNLTIYLLWIPAIREAASSSDSLEEAQSSSAEELCMGSSEPAEYKLAHIQPLT